jgi:hypothetical protein
LIERDEAPENIPIQNGEYVEVLRSRAALNWSKNLSKPADAMKKGWHPGAR